MDSLQLVIPVYNEAECVDALISRLFELRKRMKNCANVSFFFVNDGSTDETLVKLIGYAQEHEHVKLVNLSRNFGHQTAMTAGLDLVDADYAVIIDADLQDPPELIEAMYHKAKSGYDVVYGQRVSRRGDGAFKKGTAQLFYLLMDKLCAINIPRNTGDFRLINRKVLNALKGLPERHRFTRGLIPWVGFKSGSMIYHRDERFAGASKYPLRKMVRLALDAILSFSRVPLQLTIVVGMVVLLFGLIGGVFMLYAKWTDQTLPLGLTSTVLTIIIIGGFQMIMLGVMGEYTGRIFEEVKRRPLYFLDGLWNVELPSHSYSPRSTSATIPPENSSPVTVSKKKVYDPSL